jgi:hypothetical protein
MGGSTRLKMSGGPATAGPGAFLGCDYDFLQARTPSEVRFAEPVIGRS